MSAVVSVYQNHPLVWAASVLCCLGVLILLFTPVETARPVYLSNTFLPTYSIGILAWLLHGIIVKSPALIFPCGIQLLALAVLNYRAMKLRTGNFE